MKKLVNELNTEQLQVLQLEVNRKGKSKGVGWLLLLFLGGLGAHRFYYGKVGTGILYLCTLGLLGIGLLVDLFLMGKMHNEFQEDLEDSIAERLLAQEAAERRREEEAYARREKEKARKANEEAESAE